MRNTRNHCLWGGAPTRRARGLAPLLAAGLILLAGTASADSLADKSDAFIKKAHATQGENGKVLAILQIDGDFPAAKESQLKALGASIYQRLPLINAVAVEVPAGRLANLANLPFVKRVSEDVAVRKHDEFTVSASGADIAFQAGLKGTGVTVAVLDSGLKSHPDMNAVTGGSRVLASVSFVGDLNGTTDPNGHGTHVTGIIAGNGASSTGSNYYRTFKGIAPNSNIVNVRVLDANGNGTVSKAIQGIQWVIDNKAKHNIRVLNMSLGHGVGESYKTDPLCQAVEKAWNAGIVVVCAAGNEGRLKTVRAAGADNDGWGTRYGSINSPANHPLVITVGATRSIDGNRANDQISTYSSRGPTLQDIVAKPDIVAPGNGVISFRNPGTLMDITYAATNLIPFSYYKLVPSLADTPMYFRLSGTSMAAPVVSGAAALMLQKDPTLTPDTVKARLMVSADKWKFPNGKVDPLTFGAGYLNIPAALNSTIVATAPAASPTLVSDGAGRIYANAVTLEADFQVIWGTGIVDWQVIWGTQVIWGGNRIFDEQVIWGNEVTWGDQVIWGTQVIWGPNIQWGSIFGADVSAVSIFGDDGP
jgi:serine protease AprX